MSASPRSSTLGSAILVIAVALVLLRPWESLSPAPHDLPAQIRGYVVRAVDGDTLEVAFDGRREYVRLIGVDTPETVKPDTPVQCYGPRASAFEHRVAEHRRVRLVLGAEQRDVYGRLLAYVYLGHRFLNAVLVHRGLARTLTIPPNDRFAPLFSRLARRAARRGRGLWGACEG